MNLTYNEQTIRRNEQSYFCLSDMAKANGKLLADYKRLVTTNAYLEIVSGAMGIPIGQLLISQNGQPTYAHEDIALHFAQWCSLEFYYWCNTQIKTLMSTGKVSLVEEPEDEFTKFINEAKQLNSIKYQSDTLYNIGLDLLTNKYGVTTNVADPAEVPKLISLSHSDKKRERASVIAERLGYSMSQVGRAALGTHLSTLFEYDSSEFTVSYGDVRTYPATPEVCQAIHDFCNNENSRKFGYQLIG